MEQSSGDGKVDRIHDERETITVTDVKFVDTTIRDGQQSLWAYNMRTGMIAPIAEHIDAAGFEAVELGGPVELPKCIKELREDPNSKGRRCG
jgi:pyruvate/oxaloacetate carboxyltransferase